MKSFFIRDILQLEADPGKEISAVDIGPKADEHKGAEALSDVSITAEAVEDAAMPLRDEQNKSVAWRKKFSSMQRKSLEDSFIVQKYLTVKQRDLLAKKIKLSSEQVKTWYQNRRTRWRKNQLAKWQRSLWKNQLGWELVWKEGH